MATSVKHSGFKRLLDRTDTCTLGILVMGQEAAALDADSAGTYGRWQIGANVTGHESSTYITDGYGVSLATGYGASSSNRYSAFDVEADTGSTDLTGDTYLGAIRGRTVIGTTQTNASINGVNGIVDVGDAVNFQGNLWGGQFVLDFYGSSTVGSGASCYAGGIGVGLWNESTTTLGAGAVLCGIDLYQISGQPTLGSGAIDTAINIRATTSSRWIYGIYGTNSGMENFAKVSTKEEDAAAEGTYGASFHLTHTNNVALTSNRLCGMSINVEPKASTDAYKVFGAESVIYEGSTVTHTGGPSVVCHYVEYQGGQSSSSDVYGLYVYYAPTFSPGGSDGIVRLESNATADNRCHAFINFVGGKSEVLFDLGPLATQTAWSTGGSSSNGEGWLKITIGAVTRYIQLYDDTPS